MEKMLNRRSFLKAAGLTGAAAILAACTPTPTPTPVPTKAPTAVPTKAPATVAPTTAATAAPTKAAATVAPTTAPTVAPTKAAAAKISLYMTGYATPPVPGDNSFLETEFEKEFNVDLKWKLLERQTWREQYATMFAAGDIPDVFGYEYDLSAFIDQGIVAELSLSMVKKNAPKYFDGVKNYSNLAWLSPSYKSKIWGLAQVMPSQLYPFTDGWRKDYLDKAGITTEPVTIEDFEAAMTAMVAKKLTPYGVRTRMKDSLQMCFASIYGAYGTFPLHWIELADKSGAVFGQTTDGAKEALTTIQRWYKAGLIHPESQTSAWTDVVSNWCKGQAGFVDVGTWYRLVKGGELYDCIKDAGGDVIMANAPKGPKGDSGYHGWGYAVPPQRYGIQMQKDTDKFARYMQILDSMSADLTKHIYYRFGREGQEWERDETGAIVIKKGVDEVKQGTKLFQQLFPQSEEAYYAVSRKDLKQLMAKAMAGTTNKKFLRDLGVFMTQVDPDLAKKTPDQANVENKWRAAFITGAQPMDKWGDFLKERADAGGTITDGVAQQAYKRMAEVINAINDAVAKA